MSGAEIMAVVAFFVAMFGAIFGVWKYLDSKLVAIRSEADARIAGVRVEAQTGASAAQALASLAREELASHRLHVAETFVTKAGMTEQTNQIMRAIESVGNRIEGMNERLDRAFDHPPVPTPRRRAST